MTAAEKPCPDLFGTGSDSFCHPHGHVVSILRLRRGKHLYPVVLAGQLKVQFDINCQMDATEFVVFCVIAHLSKILRRHFSIAMIAELVITTFCGICVAHQTIAAAPVCLRNTQRNLLKEGSARRSAKQTSSSPQG